MIYRFYGQFQGELAPNFVEVLSGVTVRLYRYRGTKYITSLSVMDPMETMKILDREAISGKSSAFLGEAITDDKGNFALILDEASDYHGEAFDVDLLIPDVPGRTDPQPRGSIQLALTTMKPRWAATEDGHSATWSYTIPAAMWCDLRAHFDAWSICGRVIANEGQLPLPGVTVTAFDADWIQDDCLGSAITDDEGNFRIDFARNDFLRTPLSPLINYEDGGPDLYFLVESPAGEPLLKEEKAQGHRPGRVDADNCSYVELVADGAPALA
ncbi:MAG TPA: carboxypeptidase-like regulatory domain-containing protein [Caldilineaceae bacterium]|nr:carboxypeptidase-like regulatory domain-containing protein [Caldilineaceae bacterium]